jgi:hypothetical protein
MISMIGFAVRPGTAALPMCSIDPVNHGWSTDWSSTRSLVEATRPRGVAGGEVNRFFTNHVISRAR